MIGLDTNVLLRLLLDDDPMQVARIAAALDVAETAGESLHLTDVVLVETAWVLGGSRLSMDRSEIAGILRSLLDNARFKFEDGDALAVAIGHYQTAGAGFADCLIAARNAAVGCSHTITFDRALGRLPNTRLV